MSGGGLDTIAFPNMGELRVDVAGSEVVYVRTEGEAVRFPRHPLAQGEGALRSVLAPMGDRALLGRLRSDRAHHFDARACCFRPVALRERLPRVEQLELIAAGDLLLALTENGITAVDAEGRESWCIEQTTFGWRFVAVADELLWFSDANANLLGFDPATGVEASL